MGNDFNNDLSFKNSLLSTLLERTGTSGLLVVEKTGELIYVSQKAESILNLSAPILLGRNFFDLIILKDEQGRILGELHPLKKVLFQSQIQVTPYFCYLKNQNNQNTHIALTIEPVRDKTVLKGAVVKIRKIQRKIEVSEMPAVFISFAAHQLKTPSGIVKGFLELLLKEGEINFSINQWELLVSAYEANEQVISVSKTLLNLAKIQGGLIEPSVEEFQPQEKIKLQIETLSVLAKSKNISVTQHFFKDDPFFYSDPYLFSEIFSVILSNAIKFSPNHSNIDVSMEVSGGNLSVVVRDQGPGISEKNQNLLFKKAIKEIDYSKSFGLGLKLAYQYLALLKGEIGYQPNQPTGSIFSFIIPNLK